MREKMNLKRIILTVIFGSMFAIGIGILLNSDDIVVARIRPKLIEIEAIQEQRSIEESAKTNNSTGSLEEKIEAYEYRKEKRESGQPTIEYEDSYKYQVVDDKLNTYIWSDKYTESLISSYKKCGELMILIGGIGVLLCAFLREGTSH